DGQNYNAAGYDGQNYNDEGYDGQNYNAVGYDGQNYNAAGYDGQNYDAANYDAQGYDSSNYDGQDYGTGSYHAAEDENDYQQQGYEKEQYENEAYGSEAYADEGYGAENYTNEQYGTESYGQENYIEQQYTNGGYDQGQYADGNYGQNNFVDDGYGNLSYVDHSYSDNGYTEEFYVEQTYDENGNLIAPDLYSGSDYPQESYDYSQENFPDDNYAEPANAPKEYRNGLHLVENVPTPAANSSDMSQYNTINLQKVVAESMKELFPDDDDDVFAEDREKYNSAEDIGNITGSTRIFEGAANSNTAKKRLDKSALSDDHTSSMGTADSASENTHTGRVKIAQMVTGVLEAAPEPHTGAIRKVLVPGEDARLIKSDADLDALRDTTEQSVIDEHSRMEYNEENVYHEQSIMGMNETDETAKAQTTGPMKLDEVLIQWERMKQDNARKHQEEIKKRVLSQTGRIFVDFDNSIKSGILGELAREEEEARRNNQTSSTSKRDSSSKDGFLEADVTGDIPQQSASEDDFDVAYMTDHMPLTKEQESVAAGESEQRKPDVGANEHKEPDNTADKEAMASTEESSEGKASTNKTADQETLTENAANTSIEKAYDETAALAQQTCDLGVAGSKVTEYTQKIPVEDIDILNYRAGDSAATEEVRAETYSDAADQYTEDVHSAKIDQHVGSSEYAEEHYAEDNDMHAKEAGDYTKERGINEAVGGYVDDYTKELSINEAVGG
ncbi:MAG: hypothetical protein K2N95_12205, partial [Lachnospiraceae bacterium]|nr:hypothetical protein [Lachnospiraceae bacterium]